MRRIDLLLAAGWILGLIVQAAIAITTGYSDVFPPQLLLGLALCFGAGYRSRRAGSARTGKRGALAGTAMMLSIVVAYFLLAFVTLGPDTDTGGETWFSLLIELPFWLGVPFGSAAIAGYLGWSVAGGAAGKPAQR